MLAAIQIGHDLEEAAVPLQSEARYTAWVEMPSPFGPRTAYSLRRLHRYFGSHADRAEHIRQSSLVALTRTAADNVRAQFPMADCRWSEEKLRTELKRLPAKPSLAVPLPGQASEADLARMIRGRLGHQFPSFAKSVARLDGQALKDAILEIAADADASNDAS